MRERLESQAMRALDFRITPAYAGKTGFTVGLFDVP